MTSNAELSRWNQRFGAEEYVFGKAPNAFLAAHKPLLPARGRALCVADGEGRNSVWLAGQGQEVTAFDFSPVGVAKARRLAAERGVRVHYEVASVYDWRWPQAAFDVVAAIFVQFADPAMRAFMFERMVGALSQGGLLLLEGYTPKQLEILELEEYEADVTEGTRHSGRSALIDLVARRP